MLTYERFSLKNLKKFLVLDIFPEQKKIMSTSHLK